MHPDIKELNKQDPPPKGYKHPAYEVTGKGGHFSVAYLLGGKWWQPVHSFQSERQAFEYILDKLYYGDEDE